MDAICAQQGDGSLLPLGITERASFEDFFAEADPLLASLYDAETQTYDGYPLVRRELVPPGTSPDDLADDAVLLS